MGFQIIYRNSLMLFIGIAIGIIVGFILKGKITNLAELKLQGFSLILLSLAVQLVILATPLAAWPWLVQNGNLIYMISMSVLLLGLLYNRQYGWSFWLIIIGTACNIVVIAQNQGAIPVDLDKLSLASGETVASIAQKFAEHSELSYRTPLTAASQLGWMGDVLYIPLPLFDSNVYSIGDMIISIGLAAFVIKTMLGHFQPKPKKTSSKDSDIETPTHTPVPLG
ncbi:MAG: hypothetical protein BGO39_25600 [Chloroflexi bacterium 54-19]|nr:MAG: hypothetical protein BGO39_25600 [Chloroflexi bacterium 54-19]